MENKKLFYGLLVSLLVLSAFFLRIWNIDRIPAGIYPDEAVNGTDALLANETHNHRWFYTNNYGREGLFMNLISVSIRVLGNTVLGLKVWSILFGTLTVLGLYLLTKELFKSRRSGFIAAFFLAFSFWAINFSRISFRAIMVPFILTYSFYFLFKGLRTKHYLSYILAGLFFGIGFHTYIAFRVTPAILFILLIAFAIARKNFLRVHWKPIVIFSAALIISASPMAYDFLKHPEHFESRADSVSVFSPALNHGNPAGTLLKSIGLSLVKYNFWGDQNWRHNYPPYPILNPIVGIFFLWGFIYLVVKTIHLLILRFKHKIYDDKLAIYIFLLGWFFVMLSPEFLTAEGLPHALRSIGTMPVVFIIATIPLLWILGKAEQFGYFFKVSIFSLLILIFATIAIFDPVKYFAFWARNPNQHGNFDEHYKNIAVYLNSLPATYNKYLYVNGEGTEMEDGLPVSAHVIKYLTYGRSRIIYLKKGSDEVLRKPMVIAFMRNEQQTIDRLKKFYPQADVEKIDINPGYGSDFTAVIIK